MAETILIPVAKEILGKLGSLALDQIALAWSLRNELEKLKGTVSTIQAVLRDAEEKQGHNRQVKLWLEKLSDVMYDADDLLDDFSTETRRERAARADTTTTTCWTVVCFIVSFPKRFLYMRTRWLTPSGRFERNSMISRMTGSSTWRSLLRSKLSLWRRTHAHR
ncbi:unnamed protein product [Linum tenue]|uniref:Disease resistance N-terminal domain-containing protein n=1 Tax=Linum tenue TaxID=586396 RepID=A0AAV0NQT0_9ROSI|nr:unnamed protein product [Linum tenue]